MIVISNDKGFFITLSNDVYNDTTITNEELVVFTLLKKNYNKAKSISIISINTILDYMYVKRSNSNIVKKIKDAISSLIEKKFILEILDIHYNEIEFNNISNKDMFYVAIDALECDYFQVFEYDLDRIFKYLKSTNIDKFGFVRYFIATQRVINCQQEFGWLTQSFIKSICGESKTITRYNKILQDELHLILYNNSYVTPKAKYCSTFIGKYGDDVNFNNLLQFHVKEKKLIYTDKKTSNKKRSIKKKINNTEKQIEISEKDAEITRLKEQIARMETEYSMLEYKGNELIDE